MAKIQLSEAIENLRAELQSAQDQGKDQDLQFRLGPIELELEVVAEKGAEGEAKVNWWIFGGGVSGNVSDASTHKIKLTLQAVDKNGKPIQVANSAERGG